MEGEGLYKTYVITWTDYLYVHKCKIFLLDRYNDDVELRPVSAASRHINTQIFKGEK